MKALKTKVILSAAVLFFALIATIGSTYAWFTVSNTNTVQAMTLNVQTSDSLLIKVYGNQFYYTGTVQASNIVGLDGTTYTWVDGDPDTWTYDGDTFKLDASFNLVDNASGLIIEIPVADIFDTQALANTNADLNNAASYFTQLTSAQVAAEYAFASWKLAPVTAVQTGYATVNGTTANLNVFTTPNTDFTRALSPIDIGSNVNSASTDGKVIVLKFWVMSQSSGKSLYLNDLVISANGDADPVKDQVVNAIKLSAKVGAGTALIYGEDSDYRFAYTSGLPGYASAPVAGEFNSIADAATLLTAAGNAPVGNNTYVISALTVDTPTLVTVTVFLEGWDEEATNNVIAADFNISFTFGI